MINEKARRRVEELSREYAAIYGKEPDLSDSPSGLTQEKTAAVLQLRIRDNVSLLSAYRTLFLTKDEPSGENEAILSEYRSLLHDRDGHSSFFG